MTKNLLAESLFMSNVKEFVNEKKLGEGGFGVVFQDVWRGIPVAVKRIKLGDIESNGREEDALDKLDHPNVVKLFHVESDSVFKYFYLELCNASVDKLFLEDDDPKKSRKKYHGPAMPPAIEVLQQLAGGLEYIHQMNFIHRDIKPGNVLIWVDPATQNVLMKWADFGFSKPVNERGSHSISGSNRGTDIIGMPLKC
ncbi:tyrosine-protein kinase Yes-like [Daphnia pulicaria]|uniref:tyrosine-protein kinase Yes-like n=1 Tax=Daphnia pulicaria TaxID=35523 RepID=UPI001EEB822B|nr:tyrosine-protein kinase Yes-like [Daphnia pulicaria]